MHLCVYVCCVRMRSECADPPDLHSIDDIYDIPIAAVNRLLYQPQPQLRAYHHQPWRISATHLRAPQPHVHLHSE